MASDREALIAEQVAQQVAELPDRTSPDDWPEAMLVTADELKAIVLKALSLTADTARAQAFEEASEIARNTVGIFTLGADEMRRKIVDALRARATAGDTP